MGGPILYPPYELYETSSESKKSKVHPRGRERRSPDCALASQSVGHWNRMMNSPRGQKEMAKWEILISVALLYLVGGWATPLKNMSSSIGMIRNPILMGK